MRNQGKDLPNEGTISRQYFLKFSQTRNSPQPPTKPIYASAYGLGSLGNMIFS